MAGSSDSQWRELSRILQNCGGTNGLPASTPTSDWIEAAKLGMRMLNEPDLADEYEARCHPVSRHIPDWDARVWNAFEVLRFSEKTN